MEFILTMIMCSGSVNTCLPPYTMPQTYHTIYECMVDGYATSQQKMIEIGPDDVNEHKIYIKFECNEIIIPPQKPKVKT
tara:strand:- start:650 stop:886 length:237 start_codon:yes stop_codon:yes gene_type:complete